MARYLLESVLVGPRPARPRVCRAALVRAPPRLGPPRVVPRSPWTVPPALVYTLVHFGQAGYVLTFLPALVILLSRVLLVAAGRGGLRAAAPAAAGAGR